MGSKPRKQPIDHFTPISEIDPDDLAKIIAEAAKVADEATKDWQRRIQGSGCQCCSCRRY